MGCSVWDRNRTKGSESSYTVEKAHLPSLKFLQCFCGHYCTFQSHLFHHCLTTNQIKKPFKVLFKDMLLKDKTTSYGQWAETKTAPLYFPKSSAVSAFTWVCFQWCHRCGCSVQISPKKSSNHPKIHCGMESKQIWKIQLHHQPELKDYIITE